MARALFPRLGGAAPVHCVAAGDTGRPDPALSRAACATRRRAGGLLRVRRRRRLPPLFEPELLRFRQQLPYRRPLGCKLPVMGTRAAGGYVGMSEGWLGTVCALFLRSFNAATTLLKLYYCSASISSLNRTHHRATQPPPPPRRRRREDHRKRVTKQTVDTELSGVKERGRASRQRE